VTHLPCILATNNQSSIQNYEEPHGISINRSNVIRSEEPSRSKKCKYHLKSKKEETKFKNMWKNVVEAALKKYEKGNESEATEM
jgi:hypothetical protein